jgi:hypothetical protein
MSRCLNLVKILSHRVEIACFLVEIAFLLQFYSYVVYFGLVSLIFISKMALKYIVSFSIIRHVS